MLYNNVTVSMCTISRSDLLNGTSLLQSVLGEPKTRPADQWRRQDSKLAGNGRHVGDWAEIT